MRRWPYGLDLAGGTSALDEKQPWLGRSESERVVYIRDDHVGLAAAPIAGVDDLPTTNREPSRQIFGQ